MDYSNNSKFCSMSVSYLYLLFYFHKYFLKAVSLDFYHSMQNGILKKILCPLPFVEPQWQLNDRLKLILDEASVTVM